MKDEMRIDPNHLAIVAAMVYPAVRGGNDAERATRAAETAWDLLLACSKKVKAIEEEWARERAEGEKR